MSRAGEPGWSTPHRASERAKEGTKRGEQGTRRTRALGRPIRSKGWRSARPRIRPAGIDRRKGGAPRDHVTSGAKRAADCAGAGRTHIGSRSEPMACESDAGAGSRRRRPHAALSARGTTQVCVSGCLNDLSCFNVTRT